MKKKKDEIIENKIEDEINMFEIDRLYKIYKEQDLNFAKTCFLSTYKSKEENADGKFIADISKYIEKSMLNFPNSFASNNSSLTEDDIIINLTLIFEDIITAVNSLLDSYEMEYYSNITRPDLKSVDLFKINTKLIRDAYEKCYYNTSEDEINSVETISPEVFDNFIKLLDFIRLNKSLEKIYKNTNYKNLSLKNILQNLYDFHDKNQVFNVGEKELVEIDTFVQGEYSYFKKIRDNCAKISTINFDKYRSNFISKKGLNADIDKLTFCRNLLNFYKTQIMPEASYGFIDLGLDYIEEEEIKSNLKKCYSKAFDLEKLKSHQCNVIYNVDQIMPAPSSLVARQSITKDNSLAMGFVLASEQRYDNDLNRIYYLLHVYIDDISNPTCNYEIQLNVLPDTKISHRIQLVRLDNWDSVQTHKNLSKKLSTTTHIHLYNQLDLIRGKKDGGFDISFNTNISSTDFETSFKAFLDVVDLDSSIYEILTKTIKNKLVEKNITKTL